MQAPFSLDALLNRYGSRRVHLEPVYIRMAGEAGRLASPHNLERVFLAAELPALAANIPGAETIILGLCTIGQALEDRVAELFTADPVSAVVLDEIGTRWTNELGRALHERIRAAARHLGKQASPSYRPGIGRWPLDLQETILGYLPAAEIGVGVSNGMLIPQKSISMIVGVGTKLNRSHAGRGSKQLSVNSYQ
ncbi:MAG: hypothetical protein AB1801_13550 [Chloroflexota bacterium]